MPRAIFLDTFPLSSVGKVMKTGTSETEKCQSWVLSCLAVGHKIYVPEISYYECIRELKRLNAKVQIAKIKAFCGAVSDRLIPINSSHLELASDFWATARQTGKPTANDQALDGDMILCAQAISLGIPDSDFVIATTNVAHLSPFAPADLWQNITPGS